jgi:hypothetical protein
MRVALNDFVLSGVQDAGSAFGSSDALDDSRDLPSMFENREQIIIELVE